MGITRLRGETQIKSNSVDSTNVKNRCLIPEDFAVWPPLMDSMTTAQRDAMQNPEQGREIFNTDTQTINYYNGTTWVDLGSGTAGPTGATGADGLPGPTGADGLPGATGATGLGLIAGGVTGQVLAKASAIDYDTTWVDQSGGGITLQFADKEIPGGTLDGVNREFYLAHTPIVGSENIFLQGILQEPNGEDYEITGVTFTFVDAPRPTARIRVNYRY